MTETLSLRAARRLALARGGLLGSGWSDLPARAGAREQGARRAAHAVIRRFGYLQLDTVSVAGARSHSIVLMSRLEGFPASLGEALLQPGEPLFEYWGHEASWLPIELYSAFAFRRAEYRIHPWWGDLLTEHRRLAAELLRRIAEEGPMRSLDLEAEERGAAGQRAQAGWWDLRPAKKVLVALWSAGELAIRARQGFQRTYDLPERVIPQRWRAEPLDGAASLRKLLLTALASDGWATPGRLAATWRLRNRRDELARAHAELVESGAAVQCAVVAPDGRRVRGLARPADLELAARLEGARPRRDRGVLLSPFDPLLWDRGRAALLFGFEHALEIFKPAARRVYGYYVLPVLAGERLVARVDLKARPRAGTLEVLALHREDGSAETATAVDSALSRYAESVGLALS